MKKFLTMLSSIIFLSSSVVVVSCKKPNTSINKVEKNKNDFSNVISKEDEKSISTVVEKNDYNKSSNNEEHPVTNSNDHNTQKNDISKMPKIDTISKKEKEEKTDKFVSTLKNQIEDFIKNKEDEKIKNLATEIIVKKTQKTFDVDAFKKISDLDTEITRAFEKSGSEDLKTQITLIISNSFISEYKFSQEQIKKMTELLTQANKDSKEKVLKTFNELVTEILTKQFEEEIKKITSEIDTLISNKKYEDVKNKLIEFIKKTAELEKLSIK
ncbi:hypothetical protein V2P56_02435 [Mycoplasma capricolum subsp. capricolum]|uniref:Vmc-like lipoprotein signal peptide domain-containing protein n=1 Tax=Mycoplasma capricolum TaxID=2095 RepID=UPI003DA63970